MMSDWIYCGLIVDVEMYNQYIQQGFIGFVYCITDPDGKKYIGKKLWVTKRKLPPLKGKTRKRTKVVETDWRTYWGSGEAIHLLLSKYDPSDFKREILHLCKTKGQLSYLELVEQMDRRVLEKPDEYHNGIIQCKIHRNHVKKVFTNKEL